MGVLRLYGRTHAGLIPVSEKRPSVRLIVIDIRLLMPFITMFVLYPLFDQFKSLTVLGKTQPVPQRLRPLRILHNGFNAGSTPRFPPPDPIMDTPALANRRNQISWSRPEDIDPL